jgi:hypothetical protein
MCACACTYRGIVSARPLLLTVAASHDDTFLEVVLGDATPHLIADSETEVKCGQLRVEEQVWPALNRSGRQPPLRAASFECGLLQHRGEPNISCKRLLHRGRWRAHRGRRRTNHRCAAGSSAVGAACDECEL